MLCLGNRLFPVHYSCSEKKKGDVCWCHKWGNICFPPTSDWVPKISAGGLLEGGVGFRQNCSVWTSPGTFSPIAPWSSRPSWWGLDTDEGKLPHLASAPGLLWKFRAALLYLFYLEDYKIFLGSGKKKGLKTHQPNSGSTLHMKRKWRPESLSCLNKVTQQPSQDQNPGLACC